MIRIKICGITNPEDAAFAVESGVDAIGLIFAPSRRQVTLMQAKKILSILPPTILSFGVFMNQDSMWIKQVADGLGLDRIQFHGQEKASDLKQFPPNRVIKVFHPEAGAAVPRKDPAKNAGAFLVDAHVPGQAGGTGRISNWAYARQLKQFHKPLILSGGLNPDNVGLAIQKVRPDMVDVSSGVEARPGKKDHQKIRQLIQAVRRAEP